MKRTILMITVVAAGLAGAPVAWALGPVDIGLGGGYSSPTGDFADDFDGGFHGRAFVDFKPVGFPFGLRGVASYEEFGAAEAGGVTGGSCKTPALAGGLTFHILPLGPVDTYLVGTGGMYWPEVEIESGGETVKSDDSAFGVEVGVGAKLKLGGLALFGELRYEEVFTDGDNIKAVPVTFGLLF